MAKINKNLIIYLVIICLPICAILSPDWLKINGISPCWPVIGLLPFSLSYGSRKSIIVAISLGILMDSLTTGGFSYIPSLLFLGLAWGQYGKRKKNINSLFNIGLLAIFGTAIVGLSIWIQKIILYSVLRNNWFHSWSIYVLITEVIMTGLVAPIFSSWLLLAHKKD